MAKQWQIRRGTTAENDDFTGAIGELTMDTDTKGIRIHDGSTQGGFQIDTVVAFQKPTAENNYTWYRLYSSGWVEQGGFLPKTSGDVQNTVVLPITMANSNYTVTTQTTDETTGNNVAWVSYTITNQTATGFKTYTGSAWARYWQVSGMAA